MALKVAELAERTGISPDTLRYYGRLGLLAETGRTAAGHRYDEAAVERLRFEERRVAVEPRLHRLLAHRER